MDDWDNVDGVPLAELDTSGAAPSEIVLAGPDRIIITEASELAISVEGDAKAGQALRFDRNGDRLTIARDRNIFDGSGRATILVSMPPPAELGIAGSGAIEAASMARQDAQLEIAGSGNIVVGAIDADRLEVEIAGSGDVTAAGRATRLSIEIAGSGDVNFADLTADDVSVEIAGSGDVELASDGVVAAEIAGSGDVTVYGSASCSVESAGSGSLTCRPPETAAAASRREVAADE
ncbi:DUF2807 domain-containing protein [Erythrobacter sp. WH131]|uniref:DUF2807 domain-containing protein n=2 Tax=Erythrobacter ani TaxID=2827235 RepID=A0ABS6SKM8_9SPHN|nr:DUF2807 domain-containing protein [Erythrobacter ani]